MGVVTDRTILAACTKGSVQNSVCSIHTVSYTHLAFPNAEQAKRHADKYAAIRKEQREAARAAAEAPDLSLIHI